ncbi:MAG TPA: helix-turn-helix domain-containing protein [Spirochaetota bacterium]|nr:helix-turn-helix domain-containing protein [Spirochaetota bacterium]HPL15360.1 helix-turn-helix domain-containing protein [Spirochaetota bacterium]HQF08269.1 helix-turn-helix domain-containing protein [Spirochaetota bacterium]HQH97116.1 helix-turn-helix domain-containing protein [Spirochaetota bacterium]HQJ70026.1 helix-turn-helix domain-containing protein [Spirochaetota bacterium]
MDILSIEFISAAFIFFSAGLSFLLCVGQLGGRVRYFENYVLAAYLFCLSLFLFQICLIVNDMQYAHPRLLAFHVTALYFMAPIIYCADCLVILPVEAMPRRMAFLFLPVAIGLGTDIAYLAMSDDAKIALLRNLFSGAAGGGAAAARALIAGAGVQMVIYLGFLFRKFMTTRQAGENLVIFYVMTSSIVVIAGLTTATILGYITGSYSLLRWGANLAGLLVICAYLVSLRYPKILQLLMFEAEKKYAGRSLLDQVNVPSIIKALDRLMDDERVYTDDQLTLRDLADELAITPHQLSQLLNDRLNTNFNTFVNQYRIRDAKDMLLRQPEKTVLAISLEVGFNSKSAFYEAFARFTGMSPQNFRKQGGK